MREGRLLELDLTERESNRAAPFPSAEVGACDARPWDGCVSGPQISTCMIADGLTLLSADYQVTKPFSMTDDRPPCVVLGVCLAHATTHGVELSEPARSKDESYVFLYGATHRSVSDIVHDGNARNRYVSLTMSWELFEAMIRDLDSDSDLRGFSAAARQKTVLRRRSLSEPIRTVVEQVQQSNREGTIGLIFLRGKSLELLSLCLDVFSLPDNAVSACIRPSDAKRVLQARDMLAADLAREWSLNQLSREVGLNVKKLKVGFRDILGATVFGYLRELRMARAEELIRRDGFNIDQVAYAVGYSSASHFSQVFRRRFGIVPSAYRGKFKFSQIQLSGGAERPEADDPLGCAV